MIPRMKLRIPRVIRNAGSRSYSEPLILMLAKTHLQSLYEFALRGRAKEAERALEEACIRRFGTLRPRGETPVVRSDNGLIFQSRRFRAACRDYRLTQEFIAPYTPEQNGMIERFFKSLKEECTWLHNFRSFQEARSTIGRWIQQWAALHGERP